MRNRSRKARGRPLAVMMVLLAAWIGVRVVTWAPLVEPLQPFATFATQETEKPHSIGPDRAASVTAPAIGATRIAPARSLAPDTTGTPLPLPSQSAPLLWHERAVVAAPLLERRIEPEMQPSVAAGHQLLWMAAMARLPAPQNLISRKATAIAPSSPVGERSEASRWSLDAWAFWREGSDKLSTNAGRTPVYGASQLGAVMRYRLAPASRHDPRAYVRAYKAMVTDGESELAAGLSARVASQIPLRAHAELRATRYARDTEIRPAAFMTTELPAKELGLGVRGEVYAQAGYVGGEEPTAFADGQVHLMKDVGAFDLGKISLGGASWAGAQEGSHRLDLGPSMQVDLKIGDTPARLSVDWRERVAGNAEPGSGAALTLSTRF